MYNENDYVGRIEDFLGKKITLIQVHNEGIQFEYEGLMYDTLNGQSVYKVGEINANN